MPDELALRRRLFVTNPMQLFHDSSTSTVPSSLASLLDTDRNSLQLIKIEAMY